MDRKIHDRKRLIQNPISNNLILKNIEMAFLCMHWGYYENADKDMKRIVKDIKKRPHYSNACREDKEKSSKYTASLPGWDF